MEEDDKPQPAKPKVVKSQQALRQERLAAALRANLGKRKALVRTKQASRDPTTDDAEKL